MLDLVKLKEEIIKNSNDEVSLQIRRDDEDELFFVGTIKSNLYRNNLIYVGLRITSHGYLDARFDFLEHRLDDRDDDSYFFVNQFNAKDISPLTMTIIEDENNTSFLELKGQSLGLESVESALNVFTFYLRELSEEEVIEHVYMLGAVK